jgi:predicted short-subunit dehydrogenase-like oxidoreductase (DUF2520 family)
MNYRIVLIGAGNVATHLGPALKKKGHHIIQVYSRTDESARELSVKLDTDYITNLDELNYSADIYLFCLADDALPGVIKQTSFTGQIVAHTSGSVPLSILRESGFHSGVIYPVQTFNKARYLDLSSVPFCVEGSTPFAENTLLDLASGLSGKVYSVNSEKRKIIHLAAVFACNFTNHMYVIADRLMRENNLDFDIIKPLIKETSAKVLEMDPSDAQTGPAKRGDYKIIEEHLHLLNDFPGLQNIYKFVSESIAESDRTEKK